MEVPLLEEHFSLMVELLAFKSPAERYHIGSHPEGEKLIEVGRCICRGIYPYSNIHLLYYALFLNVNKEYVYDV